MVHLGKLVFLKIVDMIMIEEISKHEEGFSNSRSTLNMESGGKNKNKSHGYGRSKSRN